MLADKERHLLTYANIRGELRIGRECSCTLTARISLSEMELSQDTVPSVKGHLGSASVVVLM